MAAREMEGEQESLINKFADETGDFESATTPETDLDDEVTENEENTPENIQRAPKFTQFNAWFQTTSRLEKKATLRKKKGDIDGALEAKKLILEFQQAYLTKRREGKKDPSKALRQVAGTTVDIAKLYLIKEEVSEAEKLFKQALSQYKTSGLAKDADCMQEIKRELDRLKWQSKKR